MYALSIHWLLAHAYMSNINLQINTALFCLF